MLFDRHAVHDVMHRYALAIDSKNWTALAEVFCDSITADFRSFGAKTVFEGKREVWVDNVRATIEGMDATQHLMANHCYQLISDGRSELAPGEQPTEISEGALATGTTYIQALHRCRNDWGGSTYTIGGHYDVTMTCSPDPRGMLVWRIQSYTLNVTWHAGDRHVLRAAQRRIKT
jgi:hypothetical protein